LYIHGAVPGNIGGLLRIRDAFKKIDKQYLKLHYPTYFPKEGEEYLMEARWEGDKDDPNEVFEHENADHEGGDEKEEADEAEDDDVD